MRKRTVRMLVSTLGGALAGGFVVFLLLASLGKRAPEAASPVPVTTGTFPQAAPPGAAVEPSPSSTPDPRRTEATALGVSFRLPEGYRIASVLNALDNSQPGLPRYTITRATPEQEEQYVALIKDLRARQAATEAPEFVPGGTITLARVAEAPRHEEQLAKTKTSVTTKSGLQGTRYALVEGLYTYDLTSVVVGEQRITVVMSYASEEPRFDEGAYQDVLDSLEKIGGRVLE